MFDPGTWLAIAAALKGFETWKQDRHSKDIQKRRANATRAARENSKQEFINAMKSNKKSLDTFNADAIADSRIMEGERLGNELSELPKREYAVTDPTVVGEPKVITSARETAKEDALGEILRYSTDLGNLSASTSIANMPNQISQKLESRADAMEAGRRQQEELERLRLYLAGLDPNSQEAQMAGKLGDILLTYGIAKV